MNTINFIIIFCIFYYSFCLQEDRLVFLYTHFRHGARAPFNVDEKFNDKVKEYWTNPGELTGVGQRMHYLLGLRNRIKYVTNQNFLSKKFDPHEILIYSSNTNRTLVSVSSQLQGLYPQLDKEGEILTNEQIESACPQVDINNEKIQKEIENLGNSALPNYMILAPIRMINDNDRKINVFDIKECAKERDDIRKENIEKLDIIKEETKKFNEKYGERLNNFYGIKNNEYNFSDIFDICDGFISSYTDKRKFIEFKKIFDLEEMNNYCFEYLRIRYLYEFNGDDEKALAHVDSSKLLNEVLFYMKRRLDADMTEENEDQFYKDYSRPKMFMLSGHDLSITSDIILIIKAFNLNENEIYIYPKYASQLAIEVRTKNDGNKNTKYSDYYVVGYLDDKEIFNINAEKFINNMEKEIWTTDKVDKFCGFEQTSNIVDNSDKNNNIDSTYKVSMIIFIFISVILLCSNIFFIYKFCKKNKSSPSIDKTIIQLNNLSAIEKNN